MDGFEFITSPELYGVIPEPEPAQHEIPYWLKSLPLEMDGGNERTQIRNSTAKACMPLLEGTKAGWILKTPADIQLAVKDDKMKWTSNFDYEVISHFEKEQVGDAFGHDGPFFNFFGQWRCNAPDGWSLLVTHPTNRFTDTRFRSFTGVIDVDNYNGEINTVVCWTGGDWSGVIPQGTPVATLIPIRRDWLSFDTVTRPETEEEALELSRHKKSIQSNQRYYRDDVYEGLPPNLVDEDDGWDEAE